MKRELEMIPLDSEIFKFDCHKGLSCFTECCSKLDLLLTPYDVLRIKNRLNMDSKSFIDEYTDMDLEDYPPFPILKLKMREDGRCPFLREDGCSIYEDRPSACRLYPLARASMIVGADNKERFFLIRDEKCLGLNEEREWKIKDWLRHEGVEEYDRFNFPWFEIVTSSEELPAESRERLFKKMKAFFMASYDLDNFKRLILTEKFFQIYNVPPSVREKVFTDEKELLYLSFEWIRFVLYGKRGAVINPMDRSQEM